MKRIFILIAACCLCAACSLDEKIRSYPLPGSYYETPEQCITGLNACYGNIRNIYNSNEYFVICEAQTDLMYINRSDQLNGILAVTPSMPQFATTIWTQAYQGISRANAVEAAIGRSDMTDEQKAPLLAEAAVLRSMLYYILTSNFGDVPFYKDEVTSATNDGIAALPRMSASDTRDTLINDLKYWILERQALDMLPTNDPSNSRQYRAGAALGLMLGGKMSLWNGRWSDAVDFFGTLETIYGDLSQYQVSDIRFGQRLCSEYILEMSNISVDYGLHVAGSLASVCTPYRKVSVPEGDDDEEQLGNLDFYDGVGIPALGSNMRTRTPLRPTKHFYRDLMTASSSDLRRASYATDGTPIENGGGYLAWGWPGWSADEDRSVVKPSYKFFGSVKSAKGRPYLGDKFWCFGMQYTSDSNSYKLFRYAGALLGLAEAWFQKEDDVQACRYLNMVRSRAGIDPVTPSSFGSRSALFHEIQNEYARELFGEWQRKHDLVRWGVWYDYVMEYNVNGENNTRLRNNIRPCHEYYPIPDKEVVNSGGKLDNKEYNRYGL